MYKILSFIFLIIFMVSADTTYTTIGDGIIKSYDRFDDS